MKLITRFGLVAMILAASVLPAHARMKLEPPGPPGVLPSAIYAIREPYLFTHDVGLLALQVTNLGMFGNPYINAPSAGWRGGEYLYFSGPWIGAVGSDQVPHVSTVNPFELRPSPDPRWTLYKSFEGVKGGARVRSAHPGAADDDGDGLVDEDFRDGLDNDGDGMIDEDYAAIGQQMFSCIYSDATPEAIQQNPDHVPLFVGVSQRSFQWAAPGINEFVGIDLEFVNNGDTPLDSLYLGWFCDSDVGLGNVVDYWRDDLVGWDHVDTTLIDPGTVGPCSSMPLRFDTAFMWDAAEDGALPGVFGSVLLGHTTDEAGVRAPAAVGLSTLQWFGSMGGDPADDAARYQLLASAHKPTENPRPGVAAASAVGPQDYRYVMGVGPYSRLDPGESLRLDMALVIGEGFSGFRGNAARAVRVFRGTAIDADGDPNTGTDGKELCLRVLGPGGEILWDDPCDTLSTTITWQEETCLWVNGDCDPCTGTDGRETPLSWSGRLVSPSPLTNLDPKNRGPLTDPRFQWVVPPGGDGRVFIQWDNTPECLPMPEATGDVTFEGYRLWKVGPGGSGGPGSPDWVEIGEWKLHPDSGWADPAHLRHVTRDYVSAIGTTGDGCPIYPIGRYMYIDTTSIINCQTYYYAVTAFGFSSGEPGVEREGVPYAPLPHAVVPGDSCTVPVRLLSFRAERVGPRAIVRWSVAEAADAAGFHVYRQAPGQERVRLTEALLTGQRDYLYSDNEAPTGAAAYWLEEVSRMGTRSWHGPASLPAATEGFGRLVVAVPVPNPFQSRMSLSYTLPESRRVRISVFDLQGRCVRVLEDAVRGAGDYLVSWDGQTDGGGDAAAGLYVLRLAAGKDVIMRRALFLPDR